MKKKRLDRDKWIIIKEKRYLQKYINSDIFNGLCVLLFIDKVVESVQWDFPDRKVLVCNSGMKWLQLIPNGESYVITAMLNSHDDGNLFIASYVI